MKLFTKEQREQLIKNGSVPDKDYNPVVRLFMANTECTWLISELYSDQPDLAFGLCDLGMGFPELGYCFLQEIQDAEIPEKGVFLAQDKTFAGNFPMSAYSAAAREQRRITTDAQAVSRHCKKPTP